MAALTGRPQRAPAARLAAHLVTGLAGEDFARGELERAGWRTIGRRVATPCGEIDLVMSRGDELACVEVKTSNVRAPVTEASRDGPPRERWRPGSRFRAKNVLRQERAARFVARELRWRGSVEVALLEVWIEPGGRARGLLRRGGARHRR